MIELHLPFPPSQNHLWQRAKKGMRKTERYQAWLEEAGWTAKAQLAPGTRIDRPYVLSVQALRPDKRRRDLDNFGFKAVSDLLVGLGVITDDSLCEMLSARWVTVGGEGVLVRIWLAATEMEAN